MPGVPSRDTLTALTASVNAAISSSVMVCLAQQLDQSRLQVLYFDRFGLGAFIVPAEDVSEALRGTGDSVGQVDNLDTNSGHAPEWQLAFAGARRVVSLPIPDQDPPTCLWVGLSDSRSLTSKEIADLQTVATKAGGLLDRPALNDEARLRRLELASGLLPALMQVLDIREVFDRLSEISKHALPHDVLTLGTFDEALTTITMYARTGDAPDLGGTFPQPYPPAVVRARDFDIIDDRASHPLERDRPPTRMGSRASLRVQLRLGDRVIGGLGFMSFQPGAYSTADIAIARRLGDFVTVTLSHQQLAEQARHIGELRVRTANLELLDGLLTSLIDTGDLRQVFAKISAIVQTVIPHDAASLPILLPDGRHARVHAWVGYDPPPADVVNVPDELIRNPDWQEEIVDHVSTSSNQRDAGAKKRGWESIMRVPVKLEGRFGGTLLLMSRKPAAFKPHDLLVARRVADRLALLVSRDREVEATRRADEASARAAKLESRVRALTEELDARTGYRRVVGESPEWRTVLKQATQVAPNDTTVLLLGESGTGKEVVARFVHRASPRANGPFIALNCAALPDQLLEAELFGYERGAYTGAVQSKPGQLEQAAGGTLFLDEVGEMSLPAQAKFLRVLQEREFQRLGGTRVLRTDARVIAATNRDLERAIEQNQFREDLYYRLNVFAIYLPALRERVADILPLCEAFLAEIGKGMGRPAAGISRDARERLLGYHWPGNVRELRNILERASILCDGGLITPEHLAMGLGARAAASKKRDDGAAKPAEPAARPAGPLSSASELKSMEREMIQQALQRVRFNKSKAAKDLGLTRQQLYQRMKKHGLE